jgi:hypothetical protein
MWQSCIVFYGNLRICGLINNICRFAICGLAQDRCNWCIGIWQADALTTRLDISRIWLDLILIIHQELQKLHSKDAKL